MCLMPGPVGTSANDRASRNLDGRRKIVGLQDVQFSSALKGSS
jgi:hypothetical protein